MIERRKTRLVKVGDVKIGGNAPISIQSMTKTDTRDVAGTIRQIKRLERAGCDIVRVAVPDMEAARAIEAIKKKINIPLVADIHFQHSLALEAIKSGADKIRLNPGNIRRKEDIADVIRLAKKKKIPIRIGVNSGSVPNVIARREAPKQSQNRDCFASLAMTRAALAYIKLFEDLDFRDIIISLKASDVVTTIDAYREMSGKCDYPFHLGVTAAGPLDKGIIKSSIGIGTLLSEGIGDTIRVSLTGSPEDEVASGKEILRALGLKKGGIDIISCPTCGRCEVDLIKIVDILTKRLLTIECEASRRGHRLLAQPLKVAIMGCVVNGPGEAEEADIGIAAGKKCGLLFKKGKPERKVSEKDFVTVLLREITRLKD
ncbi:MAG: flavodoxin-dependent (E)-4-hydroxy-3-methylbut-2-enyl-diphosphate synthase [Candidatus Omnitrophica bacterium]|nr:flavodoxin-dependent (E)-4-hydroxy-3-methylbut-2-enyl-diphosphate synthase [Candidatus Omnitrophota bacterium]